MRRLAARLFQRALKATVVPRYWVDSLTFRQDAATLRAFDGLRGAAAGRPMLVVGNGPSLNRTPLHEFSHLPAIGMNKIDLLYRRTSWRPDLVVCVNNLVVQQHGLRFLGGEIPVFLAWKSRWFLPRRAREPVHYFRGLPTAEFSTDVSSHVAALGSTVTYTALQFAYFMGADPVVLLGVDHAFDSAPGASGIARREGTDQNHFDPGYFAEGDLWGLPDLAGSERDYQRARLAFEKAGRRVVDATVGGKLEVFEKISLAQLRALAPQTDV